jgi:hypothetical protein
VTNAPTGEKGESRVERGFRELDDLILQLKGLVLVRRLRERHGADLGELDMYAEAIDRVGEQLTDVVTSRRAHQAAA